jgi:hypothetical protein
MYILAWPPWLGPNLKPEASLSLSLSLSLHQPAIDHLRHPKVKVFSSSKGETFTADHFGGYNS